MITKKAFSFILLAIFSFNIVGYFISFKAVQYQIKKEVKTAIKKGLPQDKLTTITLNKKDLSQLVWEEKNKEFYFKGELYDVVKMEEKQETVIYYCIDDEQEEQLFEYLEEHIDEYVSQNGFSQKKDSKKTHPDSIKLYFTDALFTTLKFSHTTTIFNGYLSLYTSVFLEVSAPPPQML